MIRRHPDRETIWWCRDTEAMVDVVRAAAAATRTRCEIVAFDGGRGVALAADDGQVRGARPLHPAERAVRDGAGPIVVEGMTAVPVHSAGRRVVGALVSATAVEAPTLGVMTALAAVIDQQLSDRSEPRVGGVVAPVDACPDDTQALSAAILGDLTDAVIAADRSGTVRVVNRAARALFGIDATTPARAVTPAHLALFDRAGLRIPDESHPLRPDSAVGGSPVELRVVDDGGVRHVIAHRRCVVGDTGGELGVVLTFTDVTDSIAADAELKANALVDQLTGLPNRRRLAQVLDELAVSPAPDAGDRLVGACFIDLDGFKGVNDLHGHGAGDELLRIAAGRLSGRLREGDLLARQGGDEFVVLMPRVADIAEAVIVAERLRHALCEVYEIDGSRFQLTASLGVAVQPADALTPDVLLQRADTALYAAKARGRNRVERFDDDLAERTAAEQRNREMVRAAMIRNDLVMHYQPVIDSETGRAVGLEALVRCRSDDGSIVGPGVFLENLAGSHLLVDLDRRAFRQSCRAAAELDRAGHDVWVACNFSPVTLTQPDLVASVMMAVEHAGIAPRQICIEVTESGAFEAGESCVRSLQMLHDAGFGIALDDFGTGYSSLAHLRDLPLSVVKLDRSFVPRLASPSAERAIAAAVVQLADELGFHVVAEGIEHRHQLDAVRGIGFRVVQGWYFAPAMDLESVLGFIGSATRPVDDRRRSA